MDVKKYDVVVVGGGPGGYTAALYAVRAGLSALVIEKLSAGGQMATTSWIDNYPGFDEGIDGFELGQQMQRGAEPVSYTHLDVYKRQRLRCTNCIPKDFGFTISIRPCGASALPMANL